MRYAVCLFDEFEPLDAFGPAEMLGWLPPPDSVGYYSLKGGAVCTKGMTVMTQPFCELEGEYTCLLPGGGGTRPMAENEAFLQAIASLCRQAAFVLTVCTGSALLAKTGFLDGRRATSNKMAFDWAVSLGEKVRWEKKARWVRDGHVYTSSGISAGIDMALGFIEEQYGPEMAKKIATITEYRWDNNPQDDPFARV